MEAFHIYDKVTLRQEFVGKEKCLIKIAACVVPEVEKKALHTLRAQLVRSLSELLECISGEF